MLNAVFFYFYVIHQNQSFARTVKGVSVCLQGDTPDQEKLKRAKRSIQDDETSVRDEASIEINRVFASTILCSDIRMELTFLFYWQPSTKSPEDLPNAVTDDTGGKVADTKQGKVTADHATLKSIKRHSISYPSFKACNFFLT